jgi:hypothetical protein
MVIMIGWEDEILLKLKRTSEWGHNFAYLSHRDEGTLSPSILWHGIFGHTNYDSLHMMNKNGVSSFPTILRNSKKFDACILGKHSKHHFFMIPLQEHVER